MRTGSSPVFRIKYLLYGCYTKSYKLIRGSVGTGRRARLRILCILLAYGFKSRLPHKELWKQSSFFCVTFTLFFPTSFLSLASAFHTLKDKFYSSPASLFFELSLNGTLHILKDNFPFFQDSSCSNLSLTGSLFSFTDKSPLLLLDLYLRLSLI